MFYDQFIKLCNESSTKPTPLLKQLGLSAGNLQKWQKGASVNSDILYKISEHFSVSIDYLVTGKEKSSPTVELSDDEQELIANFKKLSDKSKGKVMGITQTLVEYETPFTIEPEFTYIDLYEMPVSAGTGIDLSGYDKEKIKVKPSIEVEQADFCLKISGNSMEPDFHDGDIVLIKGKPKIEIGQIGIFVVNGSGYIKELGKNRLISLNDNYDDIKFTENDSVWCMGEVIKILEEDDVLD